MELSTVSLFWRDEVACCFTSFRFWEPREPVTRARQLASCIENFSNLQLYCVIVNEQIIDWQPRHSVPPAGTAQRVEIAIYPSEPLNGRAGITTLRITIPGPKREMTEIFTAAPTNCSHPHWQILEQEVMPWLRLPNGLAVSPQLGAARIERARLVEIAEQYRPQPGRPPVDAAISATIKRLDEARSQLSRSQRANHPPEYELAKVERAQQQLAYLQKLHQLEQSVWLNLTAAPARAAPLTEEMNQGEVLTLLSDQTHYLPARPSSLPPEWADVPAPDFANPACWAQIGQLKQKFAITSERSFRRAIARLKSLGLRTLPAQQDARLRLFYRPDAERLREMLAKQTMPAVVTENSPAQPPTITSNQLTEIWQAINELQSQQRMIIETLNKFAVIPSRPAPRD